MLSTGFLLEALANNLEARTPVNDNSGDMSQERGKHNPDQGMPKFERQVKKPYSPEELEVSDPELFLVDRQAGTINYETRTGSGLSNASLNMSEDPEHKNWLKAAVQRTFE